MIDGLPEDLNVLRALAALLHERHVTRAARRVGITQSAMSQRLAALRRFFDDPLLVPSRPLMTLTPRAEALRDPLTHALRDLRAAVGAGAPFDPGRAERTFVLLGNDFVEAAGLPRVFAGIADEAPGVRLAVERTEADFAARLETGTADLAFVPDFLVSSSQRRLALPPERFVVLLRRDHPAGRRKLTLDRYVTLAHALIAPRGAPGSIVDTALEALGRRRRVRVRVQHFTTAAHVVAASDLALTCPEGVAAFARSFLPLIERPVPLELPIDRASMVWHERSQHDAGHLWLREHVRRGLSPGARRAGGRPR